MVYGRKPGATSALHKIDNTFSQKKQKAKSFSIVPVFPLYGDTTKELKELFEGKENPRVKEVLITQLKHKHLTVHIAFFASVHISLYIPLVLSQTQR